MSPARSTGLLLLFSTLVAGNVSVYREIFAPRELEVRVFTTGKSTVLLLHSPQGTTFLIDTGPDAQILRILGRTLPEWQRHIDAIILTSVTPRTAGGLPTILSNYRVTTLIRPATLGTQSREVALANLANTEPAMHQIIARRGMRLMLGGGVYADILWPPQEATNLSTVSGGLVVQISYGATSFLVKESLPPRVEKWLDEHDKGLPVPDVLIASTTPAHVFFSDGKTIR